jgi:hypothetical protein
MGDIFVAKFEKIIIKEQKIIELELLSCCFKSFYLIIIFHPIQIK